MGTLAVVRPGASPIASAFGPLNDGSWHNLTAIREAGILHLYVDGVGAGSVRNATVLSGSLWAARHGGLVSLHDRRGGRTGHLLSVRSLSGNCGDLGSVTIR